MCFLVSLSMRSGSTYIDFVFLNSRILPDDAHFSILFFPRLIFRLQRSSFIHVNFWFIFRCRCSLNYLQTGIKMLSLGIFSFSAGTLCRLDGIMWIYAIKNAIHPFSSDFSVFFYDDIKRIRKTQTVNCITIVFDSYFLRSAPNWSVTIVNILLHCVIHFRRWSENVDNWMFH